MKNNKHYNLRIPGPTPLPPSVLKAVSRQMINHRGQEYELMQKRIIENLQYFFQTKNDIFLLTSSGMGGLEASIVNFFSPGDRLVAFTCGEFGNRYAEVAGRFWADVVQIKFPIGKSIDKDEVYKVLANDNKVKGVLITLNETSTGVLNNIPAIAPVIHSHQNRPLLLVDGISALGAVDFPMDDLDIDVLVTASQKAWMAPPAISMIGVSKKAWEYHGRATMPRYYFDLASFKEFNEKNQTPATPAVSTLFGLDKSLLIMKKEGKEKIFQRHIKIMKHLREGIKKLGLKLFVSDIEASPTVTSIILPNNIDPHRWLQILREKYGVVMAGGMGETKGKIIRVAHMGHVTQQDISNVINALSKSLKDIKSF